MGQSKSIIFLLVTHLEDTILCNMQLMSPNSTNLLFLLLLLLLFILFNFVIYSRTENLPQEDLAIFGYRPGISKFGYMLEPNREFWQFRF
jgi:hypothetical protein